MTNYAVLAPGLYITWINVFIIAVNKLKDNKAPGPDGIPSEILKEGYRCMENRIYGLIVQVWNEERTPSSWAEALICPINKKRDIQNCENLRGISLVNIEYKVL